MTRKIILIAGACLAFTVGLSAQQDFQEPPPGGDIEMDGDIPPPPRPPQAAGMDEGNRRWGKRDQGSSSQFEGMSEEEIAEAKELLILDRFLRMPPEKLSRIRQTIERIESMTDEEREAMRKRIEEFKRMHPDRRHDIHRQLDNMNPGMKQMMMEFWTKLPEEEREEMRNRLKDMSFEERLIFIQNYLHQSVNDE